MALIINGDAEYIAFKIADILEATASSEELPPPKTNKPLGSVKLTGLP